jgi:DNA (cytosine-5)-methyltransferase 1
MGKMHKPYPVVDLFAGPGGLGEGFASLVDEHFRPRFTSLVAIERDEFSHQTLLLRHFLRGFDDGIPDDYYAYLADKIDLTTLFQRHKPQFEDAQKSALKISLGPESHSHVKQLISQRLSDPNRWALVGGPPCQAYSLVGRSRMMGNPDFEQDERHLLYREYLKIIIDHRPPVFVMENVKGLLSATIGETSVIDKIVADLSSPRSALKTGSAGLGYKLYSLTEDDKPGKKVDPKLFLVRAEQYGVPQARHRMFIVGIRDDIKVRPSLLRRHKAPTVKETIGNLPKVRSSISKGGDSAQKWSAELNSLSSTRIRSQLNGAEYAQAVADGIKRRAVEDEIRPESVRSNKHPGKSKGRHLVLARMHDPNLNALTLHEARGHMASDLHRYRYASIFAEIIGRSPKLSDFPRELLPNHQNVELGKTGKMFSDRFRVQLADQVSTTITSHISKDGHYFIHYDPTQCRSLTVREAARLQTFPDNYKFQGPRTSQYHQVGNAVPPYLATQIAEVIAEVLDRVGGKA